MLQKIYVFKIDPEKIKDDRKRGRKWLIKLLEQCDNIKIDFEDDGTCFPYSRKARNYWKAKSLRFLRLQLDLEVGQVLMLKIVRVEAYGLFRSTSKRETGTLSYSILDRNLLMIWTSILKYDTINVVISKIGVWWENCGKKKARIMFIFNSLSIGSRWKHHFNELSGLLWDLFEYRLSHGW